MKERRIQKQLLLYKVGMILGVLFFAIGAACIYVAEHPAKANSVLQQLGFKYQLTHSEEK